jgi:hypothetical protein
MAKKKTPQTKRNASPAPDLESQLSKVKLVAQFLRAYGPGSEAREQLGELLDHQRGELSPLAAAFNASEPGDQRSALAEILKLLSRLYKDSQAGKAPRRFDAKAAADLLDSLVDAAAGDDARWSTPKSPGDLETISGVTWRTIKRRGYPRVLRVTSRSYRVLLADLPPPGEVDTK